MKKKQNLSSKRERKGSLILILSSEKNLNFGSLLIKIAKYLRGKVKIRTKLINNNPYFPKEKILYDFNSFFTHKWFSFIDWKENSLRNREQDIIQNRDQITKKS